MNYIDTHTHIDGEEFRADLDLVISRARESGATKLFVPGINASSGEAIRSICEKYPHYCYGMLGLHPEDVKSDWEAQLATIMQQSRDFPLIAVGEVGLDFYWSREYEEEQLMAFERQVEWAVESGMPLMIHCRKAQNELVRILRKYDGRLHGGVFHCFTGNVHEAEELLAFDGFCLGIGGVLTFKNSNLPQTLADAVPLDRIVLETDAPYMAPVPRRGERNESRYIIYVIEKLAEVYGVTPDEVANVTTGNVRRIFPSAFSRND